MTSLASSRWRNAVLAGSLVLLSACATTSKSPGGRLDPWENWNRKVFSFNESLDENVLKPIATGYKEVVPDPVRNGIGNVFNNVADGWSFVNNILQGKFEPGLRDLVRFNVNTFFGLLGIVDIASDIGIERQGEDFGQTLGVWGFGAGAYIVWPLLGPSSVRDSVALPLDRMATPAVVFSDYGTYFGITALQIVNTRAELLSASKLLDEIALDKYTFVRDAYLARRRSLVYDGDPPDPAFQDSPDSGSNPGGTPGAKAGSNNAVNPAAAATPLPAPDAASAPTPASAPKP